MRREASARSSRSFEENPPPMERRGPRRGQGLPRVDRGQQLHLPGLPGVRPDHGGRRGRPDERRGDGPGHPARDESRARISQLRQAPARGPPAGARSPTSSTSPRRTRAPPSTGPPTSTTSASSGSTRRRGDRGAAFPRAVHLLGLQHERLRRSPWSAARSRYVMEQAGFPEGSHNGKDLLEILETYPRDELFQIERRSSSRSRWASSTSRSASGSGSSCGATPTGASSRAWSSSRATATTPTIRRAHAAHPAARLRRQQRRVQRPALRVRARPAPLHHLRIVRASPRVRRERASRSAIAEAARSWADNLCEALVEQLRRGAGHWLCHKYRDAFPPGYRAGFLARMAVADIRRDRGARQPRTTSG